MVTKAFSFFDPVSIFPQPIFIQKERSSLLAVSAPQYPLNLIELECLTKFWTEIFFRCQGVRVMLLSVREQSATSTDGAAWLPWNPDSRAVPGHAAPCSDATKGPSCLKIRACNLAKFTLTCFILKYNCILKIYQKFISNEVQNSTLFLKVSLWLSTPSKRSTASGTSSSRGRGSPGTLPQHSSASREEPIIPIWFAAGEGRRPGRTIATGRKQPACPAWMARSQRPSLSPQALAPALPRLGLEPGGLQGGRGQPAALGR